MSSQGAVVQEDGGGILHWVNVKFSLFTNLFRTPSKKDDNISSYTRARAFAARAAASAAAVKAMAASAAVSNPASFASMKATAAVAEADVLASSASADAEAGLNAIPALVLAHETAAYAYSAAAATASASAVDDSVSNPAVVGVDEAGRAENALVMAKAAKLEMDNALEAVSVGVCRVERCAVAAAEAAAAGAAAYGQINVSAPPDIEAGGGYVSCHGLLSCRAKIGPYVASVVKVFLGIIILGSLVLFFMKIVFEGKIMFHKKN